MQVLITGVPIFGMGDLVGKVLELDNRGYHKGDFYVREDCFVSMNVLEGVKKDFAILKNKDIQKKYNINIGQLNVIRKAYNLKKNKTEKVKKEIIKPDYTIYTDNIKKLYTEEGLSRAKIHNKLKIPLSYINKYIKENNLKIKSKKRLDYIDKKQFEKDYKILSNKEMEKKYKVDNVTIWLWAKTLNVKRPKEFYTNINVKTSTKKIINWTNEMLGKLYLYTIDHTYTKKQLKKDIKVSDNAIKNKMLELGLKKVETPRIKTMTNLDCNTSLLKQGLLQCTKCGEVKQKEYFPNDPNRKTGYHSHCKDCRKIKQWEKRGGTGSCTSHELKIMKVYFNNKCAYCGDDITPENYTLDHIVSINKGGTNDINNIALACFDCNTKKYTSTLEDFYNRHDKFTRDNYNNVIKYQNSDIGSI